MLFVSSLRSAVAAFFFLLFFAVVASAVCVAFGAGANPLLAPGVGVARLQPEPALQQAREDGAAPRHDPAAAALQGAGSASRARAGT